MPSLEHWLSSTCLLNTYSRPYQCTIWVYRLPDADVMPYKTEGLFPQRVEHTGLPVVPAAQSLHSHQLLFWRIATLQYCVQYTPYKVVICTLITFMLHLMVSFFGLLVFWNGLHDLLTLIKNKKKSLTVILTISQLCVRLWNFSLSLFDSEIF